MYLLHNDKLYAMFEILLVLKLFYQLPEKICVAINKLICAIYISSRSSYISYASCFSRSEFKPIETGIIGNKMKTDFAHGLNVFKVTEVIKRED